MLLAVVVLWATLPLGMLAAPSLWPLWCSLAGVAQGGGITVIFIAIIRRSRGQTESRQLSAMVQGCGYVVGATGPLVIGAVHDATGDWTAPLLVVLGAVIMMTVAGTVSVGGRGSSGPSEPGQVPAEEVQRG
ncbi:hypothetical protein A7K94_0210635 [Modestobacter sp. VKM Ac-2676]|nr:hypothetical protein A7K94_0210635 [Modestobacter sp. VKM Ac-2676]